ncbi:hypothetical protein D9Q98_007791 [Chlorella vulgaris]|uniref:Uncharacterized protein n=1 Tax=Chlorella vulgaris TaxID=3077 RepID=A0A9D4THH6_CHLVU|nr:hypothetical protein D9Q98_007791 [Chlorella vulgaris]
MALLRRKPSAAPTDNANSSSSPAKKQSKAEKAASKAAKHDVPAAAGSDVNAPWRRVVGAFGLLAAVLSAASEWPMYKSYEEDWRKPAIGFTMNLSITAVVSLLVACSPPIRALRPTTRAEGLSKQAKKKVSILFLLIILPLYFGFGAFGPSGAITAFGLMAFIFFGLP